MPERAGNSQRFAVLRAQGTVERDRVVGGSSFDRLEHILDRHAEFACQLLRARRVAELSRKALHRLIEREETLLHPTRDVQRPTTIAEVTLQFPQNGRDRVAREAGPVVVVVAVDCLEQRNARHLDKVFERLVGALITAGKPRREWKEPPNQLLARSQIAVSLVAREQDPLPLVERGLETAGLRCFIQRHGRTSHLHSRVGWRSRRGPKPDGPPLSRRRTLDRVTAAVTGRSPQARSQRST